MVGVIKDLDTSTTPLKAGKTIRSFLNSIGAGKVVVTTKLIGGRVTNVYRIGCKYEELNFKGDDKATKRIPKKA